MASIELSAVFGKEVESNHHLPNYITVPSFYSNEKIILDGYDNDWKNIKQKEVMFEGIPIQLSTFYNSNNNSLLGNIMIRNNESHLAIFMDLKTRYPVHDPFRRIMLPFDENGDTRYATGDTEKIITAIGPGKPLFLLNYYFSDDEGNIKPAPPNDTKGFQTYLRYISESETSLEVLIPFKNTNNFYDFQASAGDEFNIGLIYTVGGLKPASKESSLFDDFFTYTMAQNPGNDLVPGIEAYSTFVISAAICMAIVAKFTRNTYPESKSASKKISIIILVILIASIILVIRDASFINKNMSYLQPLSQIARQQGLFEVGLYALAFGTIPAILSFWFFKCSERLTSQLTFGQQLLLKASIFLFMLMIIDSAIPPTIFVFLGTSSLLKNPNTDMFKIHAFALEEFRHDSIDQMFLLPAFFSFMIWIPFTFLIFVLYYIRKNRHIRNLSKIMLIAISLILFALLPIPAIVGTFMPYPEYVNNLLSLIGPTIASIIASFVSAGGYVKTIKENLKSIKGKSNNNNTAEIQLDKGNRYGIFNSLRSLAIKFLAILHLAINTIGLSRNLFLILVVFSSVGFPISYSLINGTFSNAISNYVTNDKGQSLEAARLVYTSTVMFVSFFWIYDIVMLLKGFSEEFLDSENVVFLSLRKYSGVLTAICFLSLLVLFSINENLNDFKSNEAHKSLPIWVQQKSVFKVMSFFHFLIYHPSLVSLQAYQLWQGYYIF